MPRRFAQQRMTSSDLEWPFHASRAISAVAELLVLFVHVATTRSPRNSFFCISHTLISFQRVNSFVCLIATRSQVSRKVTFSVFVRRFVGS